ncbi:GNAT family N-acetyltransferase [Mycolicibacterium sp. 050232]|uniref:GNAT family N-acetyltransferase n=1 Tax=Mycolicibacterium sp. 050232 TaxID=3113982 RepID=UPI002E29D446|nr:GNAT family N-acetyltransferase [Mycolicibacterium sp. 050232]MED5811337.1 GNAT family N-acetyltransferase [Mycolicibacterium sp. 050232]
MGALATISLKSGWVVTLRRACRSDVAELVALITADPVAQARGDVPDQDLAPYLNAFDAIDGDPSELLVTADRNGAVVGTFQLSFLPGLARRGATRAQIEAVRVRADHRGAGLGGAMLRWAIEDAQRRGCGLVQLTSDESRVEAHRFYERLGFVPTHIGYKLKLDDS